MEELIQFSEMVSQPTTWLILLLACILLMSCADGGLQIRGQLRQGRRTVIEVFCYFTVGSVQAYTLRQSRQLIMGEFSNTVESMCFASNPSAGNEPSLLNLLPLQGATNVSGNLLTGVTFTFLAATCLDAAIYRCQLEFQAVVGYKLTRNNSLETKRLDMYPDRVYVDINPGTIDFAILKDAVAAVNIQCAVYTTAEVKWVWQYKPDKNKDWTQFNKSASKDTSPSIYERCRRAVTSLLAINITSSDKDTMYRCLVHIPKGPTLRSYAISVSARPSTGQAKRIHLNARVLSNAGWTTVSLIMFFIFCLLAHTVVTHCRECSAWLRTRFSLRRFNHRRRHNNRRNLEPQVNVPEAEREHAAETESSTSRPPNRRRGRLPASTFPLEEDLDANTPGEMLEGSRVDETNAFSCIDSPGAELSMSVAHFDIDISENDEEDDALNYDIQSVEQDLVVPRKSTDLDSLHNQLRNVTESLPATAEGAGTSDAPSTSERVGEQELNPASSQPLRSADGVTGTDNGLGATSTDTPNSLAVAEPAREASPAASGIGMDS